MQKSHYKHYLLVIISTFHICCSGLKEKSDIHNSSTKNNKLSDSGYQVKNYDSIILSIESKAKDIINWDELFEIPEFVDLYENDLLYIDSAVHFLENNNTSLVRQKICINSMQRLSIEDYLRFSRSCKTMFEKNLINEDVLGWIISPNFSKNYLITRNYTNSGVISFLNDLKQNDNISPPLRRSITDILSGKSWSDLQKINDFNR